MESMEVAIHTLEDLEEFLIDSAVGSKSLFDFADEGDRHVEVCMKQ